MSNNLTFEKLGLIKSFNGEILSNCQQLIDALEDEEIKVGFQKLIEEKIKLDRNISAFAEDLKGKIDEKYKWTNEMLKGKSGFLQYFITIEVRIHEAITDLLENHHEIHSIKSSLLVYLLRSQDLLYSYSRN